MMIPDQNTLFCSKDQKINVLLKEHEITCSQIREMVSYSDRMFALAITLAGAYLLYGVKETLGEVIVVVSFLFVALLLFSTTIYTAIFSLGGYRQYIEDQINKLMGDQFLKWERMAPHIIHSSFPLFGLTAFISILFLVVVFLGWRNANMAFHNRPDVISLFNYGYIIAGLLIIGSLLKLRRAHREAYQAASGPDGTLQNHCKMKKLLQIPGFRNICKRISLWRGEDVASQLQNWVGPNSAVVDIGCGTAGVSEAFRRRGYDVVGTDIVDFTLFKEVSFALTDGKRLPFADAAFDVGILHTTLHHVWYPEQVLLEAKRVSRRILVGEELVDTSAGRVIICFYDSLVNLSFRGHPHNNRSHESWMALFASMGFNVIEIRQTRVFKLIRQAIYVLE